MNPKLVFAYWKTFPWKTYNRVLAVFICFALTASITAAIIFEPKSEKRVITANLAGCTHIHARYASRVYCQVYFQNGHIQNVLWKSWNPSIPLDYEGSVLIELQKGLITGKYTFALIESVK